MISGHWNLICAYLLVKFIEILLNKEIKQLLIPIQLWYSSESKKNCGKWLAGTGVVKSSQGQLVCSELISKSNSPADLCSKNMVMDIGLYGFT